MKNLSIFAVKLTYLNSFLRNCTMNSNELQLNGIFIKDSETGGFTVFFAELPEIVAEGKTEKQALKNLISVMKAAMSEKISEFKQNLPSQESFKSKPIKFQFSA